MNRVERGQRTLDGLRSTIPSPRSELDFVNEYELIVAVILSAQCTDERINKVTPALFEAYPSFNALAEVEPDQVYPFIRSVSYPNNKSRHLVRMARKVCQEYSGQLPRTQSELMKLPGVGRKTAQVVSSVAFDDDDALPVDTHVFRVANRIGLVENANTPLKVERGLKAIFPVGTWGEAHHLLILHGRYTCTARSPHCDICPIVPVCRYGQALRRLPEPVKGLDARKGPYYCKTRGHYFANPAEKRDRTGVQQIACPRCGTMNVFLAKTGRTTKRIRDFRVEVRSST